MTRTTTAALAALALAAGSAQASFILDQINDGPVTLGSTTSGTTVLSQGVTAGLAGQLARIEFYSPYNSGWTGDVEVWVKAGTAPQLAPYDYSVIVDVSTISPDSWWGVDVVAAGLVFNPGDTYTIGLAAVTNSYGALGTGGDQYAGGSHWITGHVSFNGGTPYEPLAGGDLRFKTFITPAPGALALLAPVALCARRRRS